MEQESFQLVQVWRVIFVLGFVFQLFVSIWAVIIVTRLKRDQTIAVAVLYAMAERVGLKAVVDSLQAKLLVHSHSRAGDLKPNMISDMFNDMLGGEKKDTKEGS